METGTAPTIDLAGDTFVGVRIHVVQSLQWRVGAPVTYRKGSEFPVIIKLVLANNC